LSRPATLAGGAARSDQDRRPDLRGARRRALPVPRPGPPGFGGRGVRAGHPERGQRGCGGRLPGGPRPLHADCRVDRGGARAYARPRSRQHRDLCERGRGDAPLRGGTAAREGGFLMTTVIAFVAVLGILILVHEFGHFIVARLSGVGVERFSIGFGPVLWRIRGKETEYCLSAFPLGGYVKMMGDDENPLEGGKTGIVDPARAFNNKPLIIRFLIVLAGPAMNAVLAVVIFALVFTLLGRPVAPAVIGRVTEGGPAAQAGLVAGDRVVAVEGRAVQYWEDV